MRALIVETGLARGALAGVRGLHAAGWRVGVGSPVAGVTAWSRAVSDRHRLPALESGRRPFVDAVREAVRSNRYDVVFAAADAELLVLSEERQSLDATFPHPEHPVLLRGVDKLELMRAARDVGLEVPDTREVNAQDAFSLQGRVVVKPRLRLASPVLEPGRRLGTRIVTTAVEARAHIAEIEAAGGAALVQEHLTGTVVAWVAVLDARGRILVEVQQEGRRLWPPGGGVSSRAVTVPVSSTISRSARALLERLSWSGLVQLQFIVSDDGRARLIDLNPRFYGSLALAIGAGANLPAVWAAAAAGRQLVVPAPRVGERYHWIVGDLQALLAEPASARPAALVRSLRWAVGAHHSVWSLHDPAPAVWYAGWLARAVLQRARAGADPAQAGRDRAAGMRGVDSGLAPTAVVDPRDGALLDDRDATRPVERLVAAAADTQTLLATLARHGIPIAAAAPIVERTASAIADTDAWREAVIADRERGERMRRGGARVQAALAPVRDAVAVSASPLGPLWSRDVDVIVRRDRRAEAEAALRAAGFLCLDRLLARLGHGGEISRYAVMEGPDALTSVELSVRLHERGPAAETVIARARRSPEGLPKVAAADRVRRQASKIAAERGTTVRGLLELEALHDELNDADLRRTAATALRRVARLEHRLGTAGPVSSLAGRTPRRPSLSWGVARLRNARRRVVRFGTGQRVVIAFSGIDGSGKTTQAARLRDALERLGVPVVTVWGRVGFSGSPMLTAAARAGRRLLPEGSHSAQSARATGSGGESSLTRRGAIGWSWALAVTLEYLRQVRGAVRRSRGRVIILDRALPDALIDLEKGFAGELGLGLQRHLIRRLAPRADITFYLRLSGAAARARKVDLFSASVLESYAERFDELAPRLGAVVLDAERPADELAQEVLKMVTELGSANPGPRDD